MAHAAGRRRRFADTYGPWAVVTGASSGIGHALATALGARGLDLVLVARRTDLLNQHAASLTAAHGIATRVITADLARPEATAAVLSATGDLDVGLLVAAAGYGTSGDFATSDLDDELDMLAVNCTAVLTLTHHHAPLLVARGRGGIVLLSSIVAYQGLPYAAHYAATKAWVHTLAEGLHRELQPAGVDVLAAVPGPVDSGFAARADMRMSRALDPDTIAGPILDALAAHRATTVPGALSRLLRWSVAPLPRPLRTRIMGGVMAGMTRHQHPSVPWPAAGRRAAGTATPAAATTAETAADATTDTRLEARS